MSSVLKRRRSTSELEFYHNATLFRAELTRFLLNDKNVPKSYRFMFVFPMKAKLTELFDNITAANTIYPKTDHDVELRKDYQRQAIICCEQILQELQYMVSVLPINVDKLNPIVRLIDKEISLLKAWRKATKIL